MKFYAGSAGGWLSVGCGGRKRERYELRLRWMFTSMRILLVYLSFLDNPGGRDCFSFSAFSASFTVSVYKYLLHLILNLVTTFPAAPARLTIVTFFASFLRAVDKKSRISLISFGLEREKREKMSEWGRFNEGDIKLGHFVDKVPFGIIPTHSHHMRAKDD